MSRPTCLYPIRAFRRYGGLTLGASALAAAALLTACADSGGEPMAGDDMPPVPVSILTTESEHADVYREYPGRIRGAREVEVWARVQGILEERLYDEGEIVVAGAPMFRIERAPFEVAVTMAEADVATARASFRQAEREWRRVVDLYEQDAVSERERDSALGAYELAQAQVQAAEARVAQARLDLGYTDVTAPQTGAASLESVPEGSLVGPGTKLASVLQLDPVHVHFALPETDALVRRAIRNGMEHEAVLILPDGSTHPEPGVVDFTASAVDAGTGSISARAVYNNADRALVPGQFVRVRLLLRSYEDIIVLPELTVGEGPDGPQVFVPADDGETAVSRPVSLGPVIPEGQIILGGIESGERVIVNGHARLFDGAPIAIEPAGEPDTPPEDGDDA